jgi:exodeoxyribonuclease I
LNTFLFYDIETTGLNPAFDQILDFSAIRTDMALNELERHTCKVRLRPDVIPSPGAVLTHGMSAKDLDSEMCEFEAAAYIHRLVNTPGTISIGFNTLGFDDEFLRFTFHRNLLPPYTHQYGNGCFRADMLPITVIFFLYRNDALIWPEIEGKTTLKLEHLKNANSLASGPSHDAMVDVEATLGLARRFLEKTEIWKYLLGCFEKRTDTDRVEKLPVYWESSAGEHRLGLMIGSEFGAERNFQVPVVSIGHSEPYSNQSLWLRLDQAELQETTPETIADNTWVIRKKFGEPGILLPPLERFRQGVSPERWAVAEENRVWLKAHHELFLEIVAYYRQFRYPEVPHVDLDAALYQIGFPSAFTQELCRKFHGADPVGRVHLIEQFPDSETQQMAIRVLGRNYPGRLPRRHQKVFDKYMAQVNPTSKSGAPVDYKGNHRTTPRGVLAKIERFNQDGDLGIRGRQLLHELEVDLRTRFGV